MNRIILSIRPVFASIILLFMMNPTYSQTTIQAPNGKLELVLDTEQELQFSVKINGESIIQSAKIDLEVDGSWALKPSKVTTRTTSHKGEIIVPFSYKQKVIQDEYNGLVLEYGQKYQVEFRVFDLGVAYRIMLRQGAEMVQINEKLDLQFAADYQMWSSLIEGYGSSYEEVYSEHTVNDFPEHKNTYTPLLLAGQEVFVHITDADVYDYPHLFFEKGDTKNSLQATFPSYPLKTEMEGSRGSTIVEAASYCAKTSGQRDLPWRVFHIVEEEQYLLESNLVYQLSRAGEEEDYSWVKPGKVAWDWWNAFNLYGVDFETGFNTKTWQAYIDFAAQNGLEYIIMDEGWSASLENIKETNPDVDLPFLIQYANEREVGIVLWSTWRGLLNDWTVLDQFQEWGVAGIKVDFMDRADQWMVNYYEKVAQETAKRKMFVDFHGAYKPAGMRRKYPNILSYEGVCGLEYNKWSKKAFPKNTTKIPFIRMIAGPMDYTPGAMRNYFSDQYKPDFARPGSQGTRAHQVALLVLFESGIQMLADSPSNYNKEPATRDFLTTIPVEWDDLKVLEAAFGSYLTIARKSGDDWYIGSISSEEEPREVQLDCSFLGKGSYQATIYQDGVNVAKFAEDYRIETMTLDQYSTIQLKVGKEGGFAIRLERM